MHVEPFVPKAGVRIETDPKATTVSKAIAMGDDEGAIAGLIARLEVRLLLFWLRVSVRQHAVVVIGQDGYAAFWAMCWVMQAPIWGPASTACMCRVRRAGYVAGLHSKCPSIPNHASSMYQLLLITALSICSSSPNKAGFHAVY